jgi:hypothetical protein
MNQELAALEEAITRNAREAAIEDVGKVFSNLKMDLYRLGVRNSADLELEPLKNKAIDLVTKEKACLLAEDILRRNKEGRLE